MGEVYIAAVGLTKVDLTGSIFGNVFDLFQSAYRRALAESEVREFDALQVGIMHAEEFESRANIAAKVADRLGLAGIPAVRSETASSTGAAAFHEACYKIRSGAASSVLVIAGERMKTVTTQVATEIMSKTVDPVERRFGFTMPALIALVTQAFFQRRGVHGARVADVLSRLMFRAHALGADNPLAAFAGKPEPLAAYFDETRNLPVATPLRRKDCSPICDGAAAIILSDRPQAVRVAGLGAATDTASLLDRVELDSLAATRRAAAFAFHQAGVADPGALEGLVVESHDAFNSLLPLNLVDLGLSDPEQALEALIGGARGVDPAADPYAHPWSGPSGHRPVNLSGGLKSRGHPVGGTGLGFVDVFDTRGRLVQRLESGPWFNAPWGVVLTPGNFGEFSHAILVGQFRGGTIAAFNPVTGRFMGNVLNPDGTAFNSPGLWALQFGAGNANSGSATTLFFTAGPGGEVNGLFATLTPVAAELNEADEL